MLVRSKNMPTYGQVATDDYGDDDNSGSQWDSSTGTGSMYDMQSDPSGSAKVHSLSHVACFIRLWHVPMYTTILCGVHVVQATAAPIFVWNGPVNLLRIVEVSTHKTTVSISLTTVGG